MTFDFRAVDRKKHEPLTAAKKKLLHCTSNENLFYIWNVVFKIKFVLQNRQLSLAANRYFQ
jgi:hypothetical protein